MPYILNSPISRKQFLKKTLKVAGSMTVMGYLYQPLQAAGTKKFHHFALLSDTHVKADTEEQYRGFFPYKNLTKVIGQVRKAKPEFMLIDGDVARLEGHLEDYVAVQEIIEPVTGRMPVAMGLGNHDDRGNFSSVFRDAGSNDADVRNKHVMVMQFDEFNLLILDSLLFVNKTPGLLGRDQRDWLDRYLKGSGDKPVFLFVHHTLADGDGDLLDSDRFFDIILPHQKVKAVFYGHSHVYEISRREHIKLINLPAVGYNFNDDQPVGWIEAQINAEMVKLKLHAIGGNMAGDGEEKEVRWD